MKGKALYLLKPLLFCWCTQHPIYLGDGALHSKFGFGTFWWFRHFRNKNLISWSFTWLKISRCFILFSKTIGDIFNNTRSFCIPFKWNFPPDHPCSAGLNMMDSAEEQCGMRRTRIHTELSWSNPRPPWWGCCNSRGEAQRQSQPPHMSSPAPVD